MVNDRTPQSLVNSSSLIWVSPNTALAGPRLPAPAPGAQRTRALQIGGVFAGRKGTSSHRRGYRDTDVTGALSVEAVHPCSNTIRCTWCRRLKICSEQNRRLSVMKYIYNNRETSNIKCITHALGHCTGY